ncbi:MAG: domain S-box protein [Bacteroidetes bacterium]|nr:domain S-box protein [Bacteroidota bacterium]
MKAATGLKKKKISLPKKAKESSFPIVAIGASAGGLEAVSILLKNLRVDTGMAYIYVQHLNPEHKSFLVEILSKTTKMQVHEIDNMELMEPNNVYVIPHNKGIEVTDGHIKLLPRSKGGSAISIDVLFASLAETHKEEVIGVILSGNASDGTRGLKAIKAAGGLTFAQDDSAQVSSMPKSAIAAKTVDFVLSPKEIAQKLGRLSKNDLLRITAKKKRNDIISEANDTDLKPIFELLHKKAGIDFSHYKIASIKRRLNHKMLQCGVKTIKEYEKLLNKKNDEAETLCKDLLINVTCFFRDTETFRYLKTVFFPKLLKSKTLGETLRIWIPACSTGEEAYSIAMLIAELQDHKARKVAVQIFATDLSEHTINIARIGEYSQGAVESVSQKQLKRFFSKTGDQYRIVKELREMCVFAPHNILSDPPFFRIDFVSCRNLLIYFDAAAQKKALASLHFSLNDGGTLMLGKSETIGSSSQLFTQINNKFKIYSRKKNTGIRKIPELMPRLPKPVSYSKNSKSAASKKISVDSIELDNTINSLLLSRYMPACAIINKDMEILQFRGLTSLYLSHPSGKASLNILKMMRPEFSFELRNAIHKAIKTKQSVVKSGIEMKIDAEVRMVTLEVFPLKLEWDEPLLLIVFTFQELVEKFIESGKDRKSNTTQKDRRIKKLVEELNNARLEMQSVIESQEASFEELQAANEEVVSTNEEFQTLNEELETSKEEIQATNEELISTNRELKMHNELLEESYNYSQTIIATIHEPMLVLDSNLHVKSANKSFYKKFLVTQEETEGMPLFELGNKQWNIPKLHELLATLLSKNTQFENLEVIHEFPGLGEKVMLLNASRIIQKTHREKLILLAIKDITERSQRQRAADVLNEENIRLHKKDKLGLEKAVKHRTKELEEKNVELESANKDLTTFTYVSSHDLQEPLRKIQNFASVLLLEEEKNLSDNGKEYFKRMRTTAKRMQGLIEDLLTYSRTKDSNRKFENTSLNRILSDVINDYEEALKSIHGTIEVMPMQHSSIIPFQFRQLFQNLVSNSVKFSNPKVPLRIVVKNRIIQGSKKLNKQLSPDIKYLNIIFSDNGIGFDPQYNSRIFEVFQRLQNNEQSPGTGIGLAICKRIVENHHGVITANGKVNKGVRVDIYLPLE